MSENIERVRNWGTLLDLQHFGVRRTCWSSGMRLGRMTSNQSLTWTCTNQTTSWLVHSWNTSDVGTSHEQTWIHKTHHGPNLGEATTFPLIVYFVLSHGTSTQMTFCPGTPKFSQFKFSRLWGPHNFACRLLIKIRSKTKLFLSSRAFQWYVACHLHASKLGQYLTFSGWESNC